MDMFMDKLAQKLTAQEIIKANTVAETEELNRLRNQIVEYDQCLTRLQQLIEEGGEKLKGGPAASGEIDRLVEESMGRLTSGLQQTTEQNEQLQRQLTERLGEVGKNLTERFDEADRRLGERLGNVNRSLGERLESVDEHLENMDRALDERLESLDTAVSRRLEGLSRSLEERLGQQDGQDTEELEEQLAAVVESVHRECVKVYRNVQAVVLEESGKLTEAQSNMQSWVDSINKKMSTVQTVAALAFGGSIIGIIVQILTHFNIF